MSKQKINMPNEKKQDQTVPTEDQIDKYEAHLLEEATDTEPVKPYPTWVKAIVIIMVLIIVLGLLAAAAYAFL
ncbi:hypothetical protein IE337_01480 [Weissella viridescens]|uniref:hypothetical protein n=1 Tax=Weissella viridescens TaxID=1629 RepID=UPI0017479937|nr:hypothetical protein [Weissella viridescens]QOD86315.1 hypothetical protein IE337_01480 [Weissella viridescens]